MKIISPNKISRKVEWRDLWRVLKDSWRIKFAMMKPFDGKYPVASSISHCQIEERDPLRFFVLGNSWHVFEGAPMKLKKFFGWPRARTIINPEIIGHGKKTMKMKEGCMSWEQQEHKIRKLQRWQIIDLKFWTFFGPRVKRLYLYRAAIAQHEINHADGLTLEDVYAHNTAKTSKSSYELV